MVNVTLLRIWRSPLDRVCVDALGAAYLPSLLFAHVLFESFRLALEGASFAALRG